jgi:hypothetical protein
MAPDLMAHILVEAGKMGGVTIRQVYGNWAAQSMQPWKKIVDHYTLEQLGNRPGHNATDIALVIGAMDLLHQGIKHFCLVAGDSDYVPLVDRLRKEGCTVLVIGTTSVSTALKETCNKFISTTQLLPPTRSSSSATITSAHPPSQPTTELATMLVCAYQAALTRSETEWVPLSALGSALLRDYPDYQKKHGKHLTKILQQHDQLFEMRQRAVGKGQVGEVRLLQNTHKTSS